MKREVIFGAGNRVRACLCSRYGIVPNNDQRMTFFEREADMLSLAPNVLHIIIGIYVTTVTRSAARVMPVYSQRRASSRNKALSSNKNTSFHCEP